MGLFTPPETSYDNLFDKARFDLTWKLNAFMGLVNLVMILIMFFLSTEEFLAAIYGWIVPVIYLLVMWKTRKYKALAVVYVILGVFSTGLAINFFPGKFHLIEVVFMVMISLYAYFTLGRKVGHTSVIIQGLFVVSYVVFRLNLDIYQTKELSDVELLSTCFNFMVAFVFIGYLIQQFITINNRAEERYVGANKRLEEIYKVVRSRDAEKTVMLKEIHHRVKNNLQVITSLLRLQSYETDNEESKKLFEEAVQRVMAMSLIHEKMYQSEDLAALDLKEYLKSLSADLIESYSIKKNVSIDVESEPIDISDKHFVPIALICNELISNSLKHAFEGKDEGRIKVSLKKATDSKLEFTYGDDGKWKDGVATDSFGVELIQTLAEQLGSEIHRNSESSGTVYTMILPDLS